MLKKFIFILAMFYSQLIIAQTILTLSPGIKLGYAFGENGGFVFGVETSLVIDYDHSLMSTNYGFVLSYEILNNEKRVHVGVELNIGEFSPLFGMEFGPTFVFKEKKSRIGLSLTPYFGVLIIPYLRITVFPKKHIQHEIGTFLKLHIPVKGEYDFGVG